MTLNPFPPYTFLFLLFYSNLQQIELVLLLLGSLSVCPFGLETFLHFFRSVGVEGISTAYKSFPLPTHRLKITPEPMVWSVKPVWTQNKSAAILHHLFLSYFRGFAITTSFSQSLRSLFL